LPDLYKKSAQREEQKAKGSGQRVRSFRFEKHC